MNMAVFLCLPRASICEVAHNQLETHPARFSSGWNPDSVDLLERCTKDCSEDDLHKFPMQPMALDPLHITPTTSVFCSILPPKPLQVAATWLDRIHSLLPKHTYSTTQAAAECLPPLHIIHILVQNKLFRKSRSLVNIA